MVALTTDLITKQLEMGIRESQILSQAASGRYYRYDTHEWQSVGWIERVLRSVFFLFADSVQKSCTMRSWTAVAEMPETPTEIAQRIKGLFLDSLVRTNYNHSPYARIFARIFCTNFRKDQVKQGKTVEAISVQGKGKKPRTFTISRNERHLYNVASSQYGHLDFYQQNTLKMTNTFDSLWTATGERIAATKLDIDYHTLCSSIELSDGSDKLLLKVTAAKGCLAFRDASTNKLLAVGIHTPAVKWRITLIETDELQKLHVTDEMLGFTALKYSQHYHFAEQDYYTGVPS